MGYKRGNLPWCFMCLINQMLTKQVRIEYKPTLTRPRLCTA